MGEKKRKTGTYVNLLFVLFCSADTDDGNRGGGGDGVDKYCDSFACLDYGFLWIPEAETTVCTDGWCWGEQCCLLTCANVVCASSVGVLVDDPGAYQCDFITGCDLTTCCVDDGESYMHFLPKTKPKRTKTKRRY